MPIIEYKCDECHRTFERIIIAPPANVPEQAMCACGWEAFRQMSIPAFVRMDDGSARRKRERIKEPIWRYPDGSFEPVNP